MSSFYPWRLPEHTVEADLRTANPEIAAQADTIIAQIEQLWIHAPEHLLKVQIEAIRAWLQAANDTKAPIQLAA